MVLRISNALIVLVLATAATLPVVSSKCRQSYVTICDNFEDVKKNADTENWSELIVGSVRPLKKSNSQFASVNLQTLVGSKFKKLRMLTIIRRIDRLEQVVEGTKRCSSPIRLEFLSLYKNELKRVSKQEFPKIYITKLSLAHNKIEEIKPGAFQSHKIVIFDLSNNLLKTIETGALPATRSAKTMIIKNNKLTKIAPRSFSSNLRILNLDGNYLKNLSGVLENLNSLEELTLSRNKFVVLTQVSHLKRLKILDMSFNGIKTIQSNMFKEMNDLQLLNLDSNQISDVINLEDILNTNRQHTLTIFLAFNRLTKLNLTVAHFEKVTLVLYGNPWNCDEWDSMATLLVSNESVCGLKYYASGKTPFCIRYTSIKVSVSEWEKQIKKFHDAIRQNTKLVGCDLEPKKYNSQCVH